MFLLTTLPCASEQSRMEITYPKWCRVCQILWQDIRLMAIIMLFYFYWAGSQANEGNGIFCWCFTYRWFSPKYNALLIFFFKLSFAGFRKSTLQDQKVVSILSVGKEWAGLQTLWDFSENSMISLASCCFLRLWGASGPHLQVFLHVHECKKPTVQRQKLRFVCS